ncbi:MAG: hypothetical protein KC900_09910 [Candidatus Omnitrophica bacterium]|nr:hypothetical protein [Candidatus Omnitrophota bacterium]
MKPIKDRTNTWMPTNNFFRHRDGFLIPKGGKFKDARYKAHCGLVYRIGDMNLCTPIGKFRKGKIERFV